MPSFDQSTCRAWIFTYKEGLLSRVAHDLKLEVTRFTIAIEETGTEARLDTRSLRVVCAQQDGRDAPSLLSSRDHRKIESQINSDVLHSARFPEATFRSEEFTRSKGGLQLRGRLILHGRERPLAMRFAREGKTWRGETWIHQPDFGIVPFKAAFGALKVKADVKLRLELAAGVVESLGASPAGEDQSEG